MILTSHLNIGIILFVVNFAALAQLVEHHHGKVGVVSSSLIGGLSKVVKSVGVSIPTDFFVVFSGY